VGVIVSSSFTDEVCRLVGAALSSPHGDIRVGTERPGAVDRGSECAVRVSNRGGMSREDCIRHHAVLYPVDHVVEGILGRRPCPTAAMSHTGRHEEPGEVFHVVIATAQIIDDLVVVVDSAFGHDQLIVKTMPDNNLTAMVAERSEVRVIRAVPTLPSRRLCHQRKAHSCRSPERANPIGVEIDPILRLCCCDAEGYGASQAIQIGPRVCPYQRSLLPFSFVAPNHILLIADASDAVRQMASLDVHVLVTKFCAS